VDKTGNGCHPFGVISRQFAVESSHRIRLILSPDIHLLNERHAMKQKILRLSACLALTGCAVITYQPDAASIEQIEALTPGMTINQVQKVLGKPYKVSQMYEGVRDENIYIHQYAVACGVYPFDKHNSESGWLTEKQINGKFKYRLGRTLNTDIFNQVYYLRFIYEDSLLIKYETVPNVP